MKFEDYFKIFYNNYESISKIHPVASVYNNLNYHKLFYLSHVLYEELQCL